MSEVEKNREVLEETQKKAEITTKKDKNVPVEMNVLELAMVFNPSLEELEEGAIERKLGKDSQTGEEYYIMMTAPKKGAGLCRREDLNTFLVCFLLWYLKKRKKTFPDEKLKHSWKEKWMREYSFYTTYYQLARLLFNKKEIGGKEYRIVKESIKRLVANFVETNYWYSAIEKKRFKRALFHWISAEYDEDEEKLKITFDEEVGRNMEEGYLKFLNEKGLIDIVKIRSPFVKVLILLFMKRHFSRESYIPDYSVWTILEYLGVKEKYEKMTLKRRNENIKRYIIPAVKEAAEFLGYEVIYGIGKDEEGNIVKDPPGEEKFRFKRKLQSLFTKSPQEGSPF